MKKYKDFGIYDFSDYAEEITGDALFKINGGAEIENSIEAQANAKVGDTVTREDGTTHTLYKGDIDWAQKEMAKKETKTPASGSSNNTNTGNISTGNTASNSSHNQSVGVSNGPTTITEKKEPSPAVMYDSHDPSRVFVDLDNPKAMQQAADLLAEPSLGLRVTAYGSESGITKNFKNYQEINDYLESIRPKTDGGITWMDVVGGVSTATGIVSSVADKMSRQPLSINNIEQIQKGAKTIGTISILTGIAATFNDSTIAIEKPTFKNLMRLGADTFSFIPEYGPAISIVTNVTTDLINDGINAGLDIYSPILQKEQMFDNVCKIYGEPSFMNVGGLSNVDVKTILFNEFKTFFGD